MNKNILVGGISLVIVTSILTFGLTAGGFFAWDKFHPKHEIQFESSKVDFKTVEKFNKVKDAIEGGYYEDVDETKLLEGAISGMADSLKDPYTVYFSKEQMSLFNEKSEGSYYGVGISVIADTDGLLKVVEVFDDSPAKSAGVQYGDKIIKVDDKDVGELKDEDIIISMIKGPENTPVTITFYRSSINKSVDLKMLRQKIKISNIKSEVLQDDIGYIKIVMFDSNIAKSFKENLNNLLSKNIKGLIIDVRDNPGGSYQQVVEICDSLLPEGVIVYTQDKYGKKEYERSDATELGLPISVLVNGYSASASEVLSGALKDHNKAVLVGEKTFGKGLVQTVLGLDDGSGLKLTIARYYTPSGVCIQGIGINPDYEIKNADKYKNTSVSQITKDEDLQLKKAVDVLNDKIK